MFPFLGHGSFITFGVADYLLYVFVLLLEIPENLNLFIQVLTAFNKALVVLSQLFIKNL